MAGFGSVPGAPPSGIQVEESLPDPSRALEDIRDRYCLPTVNVPTGFSLGALIAQRYDYRNQKMNALLVTVTSGTVYGYFGGCRPSPTSSLALPSCLDRKRFRCRRATGISSPSRSRRGLPSSAV
jgi:hypothetical protein